MSSEYGHHLNVQASTFVPPVHPAEVLSADAEVFVPTEESKETTPRVPPSLRPLSPRDPLEPPRVYSTEFLLSMRSRSAGAPAGVEIPKQYLKASKKKKKNKKKKKETPEPAPLKELRVLLNKISADNFSKIGKQLLAAAYSRQVLQDFVTLIFAKHTHSHTFLEVYARLCAFLKKGFKQRSPEFSSLFTNVVAAQFQEHLRHLPVSDLQDSASPASAQAAGLVKFAGLLFHYRVLKAEALFQCFDHLLESPQDEAGYPVNSCIIK